MSAGDCGGTWPSWGGGPSGWPEPPAAWPRSPSYGAFMVTPPHRPGPTGHDISTVHSLTRAGRVGAFRCGVRCRVTRLLRVVCPGQSVGLPLETIVAAVGILRGVDGLARLVG